MYRYSLIVVLMIITLVLAAFPAQAQTDELCFSEVEYCISGRIREFWEQNGGLPVFGFPIGPQQEMDIEGQMLQAQWFERNRLELHPENEAPYDVLLGRLGVDYLDQEGRDWQAFPSDGSAQDGCQYFEQTGQNVCGDILALWQSNGLEIDGIEGKTFEESLALFGLPISQVMTETIQGGEYEVQWFERARFELHPENDPPFNVLLGLLGTEVMTDTDGGDTPTPDETPTPEPDMGGNTIVEIAAADGRFSTLVTALETAALTETLSGEGPFTVFAPVDDAFADVDVDALLSDTENLSQVLLYHVAAGSLMATDVVSMTEITTVQGGTISVMVDGDSVMLNDTANIILTDIEASNGVIHVIDAVLFPPTE